MSKIEQTTIHLVEPQYKLTREEDEMVKYSRDVMWLEWNEEGHWKDRHSEPAVGRSLLMSPFNDTFTWMTTDITEILHEDANVIRFKTKNSTYRLCKI
jgi:hypothetical protein